MKVTILGGTGFIGCNFVRHLLGANKDIVPLVLSLDASNLTNISRYCVEIKLLSYNELVDIELPHGTDYLINFSHPFSVRENLSVTEQVDFLLEFMRKQLMANSHIKLIHLSSMSIYEPFGPDCYFDETHKISVPSTDQYASSKARFEQEILKLDPSLDRVLILRPTVVFGPFCRPWTDNIMKELLQSPVVHLGLSGRIQPIWVSDISAFILDQLESLVPGIYNMPGPETMSWRDYFEWYARWVGKGEFIQLSASAAADYEKEKYTKKRSSIFSDIKKIAQITVKDPDFRSIVRPYYYALPKALRRAISARLATARARGSSDKSIASNSSSNATPFCKAFFEEDRLVSPDRFNAKFPDRALTSVSQTSDVMTKYFRYRFNNEIFQ